ncbi:hypothetical protein E6P97_01940 [Patescibacteria group bacterium]|nr:MAG: hypothetical protein E6P97_01940 [Patescibacteria group bacterium]
MPVDDHEKLRHIVAAWRNDAVPVGAVEPAVEACLADLQNPNPLARVGAIDALVGYFAMADMQSTESPVALDDLGRSFPITGIVIA